MNPKIQRTLPVLLSISATAGVIGTSYLAAKAAKGKVVKDENAPKPTKKEAFVNFVKKYKWPLLTGGATIASIITGTVISKRIEASLSATVLMLDASLRKYKSKAKQVLGEKAELITKEIANYELEKLSSDNKIAPLERHKKLYWLEPIGFFTAYPESVLKAELITNEKIWTSYKGKEKTPTDHWASVGTFLEDCHAVMIDKDGSIDKMSYDYGWTAEYLAYGGANGDERNFLHLKRQVVKVDQNHKAPIPVDSYIILTFDIAPVPGIAADYRGWDTLNLAYHKDSSMLEEASDYAVNDLESTEDMCEEFLEKAGGGKHGK